VLLSTAESSSVDGPVVTETDAAASASVAAAGAEDGAAAAVAGTDGGALKERDDPALLITWGYGTNDCEYLNT